VGGVGWVEPFAKPISGIDEDDGFREELNPSYNSLVFQSAENTPNHHNDDNGDKFRHGRAP
jgi:hypothetical protein